VLTRTYFGIASNLSILSTPNIIHTHDKIVAYN
jgi:hypothetical protein